MPIEAGLSSAVTLEVGDADTSIALGSGDVPVLATPRLVLLAEEATVAALEGSIPADTTTVGYRVQIDHLAPTPVGATVTVEALLISVEGRRLVFRVSASDDNGLVAAGRITRVVVDRERFLDRAAGLH